jgi:hypothetical protein
VAAKISFIKQLANKISAKILKEDGFKRALP